MEDSNLRPADYESAGRKACLGRLDLARAEILRELGFGDAVVPDPLRAAQVKRWQFPAPDHATDRVVMKPKAICHVLHCQENSFCGLR